MSTPIPETHKAALLASKGGPLSVQSIPTPKVQEGTVLIRILACALNPADAGRRRFGVFIDEYPAVLGWDVAGDVVAVGDGVEAFKPGDRVLAPGEIARTGAGFQQYCVVRAPSVVKIPNHLSYDAASTIPVAFTAAFVGLYNKPPHGMGINPPMGSETQGIYAGQPIVVLGGSSSVGQYAIQLAKLSGFSLIITTAAPKHESALLDLGATHIVDRSLERAALVQEIISQAQAQTSKPIQYVFDGVSTDDTQQIGVDILSRSEIDKSGSGLKLGIVRQTATSLEKPKDKNIDVITALAWFFVDYNYPLLSELFSQVLPGWLERGVIKTSPVEVLPNGLGGIEEGLNRIETGKVSRVKLVARPHETP